MTIARPHRRRGGRPLSADRRARCFIEPVSGPAACPGVDVLVAILLGIGMLALFDLATTQILPEPVARLLAAVGFLATLISVLLS